MKNATKIALLLENWENKTERWILVGIEFQCLQSQCLSILTFNNYHRCFVASNRQITMQIWDWLKNILIFGCIWFWCKKLKCINSVHQSNACVCKSNWNFKWTQLNCICLSTAHTHATGYTPKGCDFDISTQIRHIFPVCIWFSSSICLIELTKKNLILKYHKNLLHCRNCNFFLADANKHWNYTAFWCSYCCFQMNCILHIIAQINELQMDKTF